MKEVNGVKHFPKTTSVECVCPFSGAPSQKSSDTVHDHACEVLQLDVVIVDELSVCYDLLDLRSSHPFSHVHHRVLELLHRDLAIFIRIEHL